MSTKKQYAFSLVVSGTQKELKGLIPELENLGYVWHDAALKIINDGDIIRTLDGTFYTYKCISNETPQNCLTVAATNRPLVLALAATCTNDRWQEDEWMIYVPNGGWQKVNKMWGYNVENTHQYRRPTLAEIQHHFRQDSDHDFEVAADKVFKEKDYFVLPERWCIARNGDNKKTLNAWADKMNGTEYNGDSFFINNMGGAMAEQGDHTLITFDQFKKHVLKDTLIQLGASVEFKRNADIPNTKHTSMCILKAHDDEPIFVLRATDPTASKIIGEWIKENIKIQSADKLLSALNVSQQMEQWRKDNLSYFERQ